jgi:hypothetical protein
MSVSDDELEMLFLSNLFQLMDSLHLERNYAGLGSAAKIYRDNVTIKLLEQRGGLNKAHGKEKLEEMAYCNQKSSYLLLLF